MKCCAEGLLKRCARIVDRATEGQAAGYRFMLEEQLLLHLNELARRFYAGDLTVVDEFLQLYCLGENERKAVVAAQTASSNSGAESAQLSTSAPLAAQPAIPAKTCENEANATGGGRDAADMGEPKPQPSFLNEPSHS